MSITRRSSTSTSGTTISKGMSLSRGPALILGTVLLIAGLFFLYRVHNFTPLSRFPSGDAATGHRAFFGIFGLNGWSGELTAAAGALLLFGAAQHLLAKTASLISGIVLAVVAIIALFNHNSALGLFHTNIWTIILWGVSAALLLINVLIPRRSVATTATEPYAPVTEPGYRAAAVAAAPAATAAHEPVAHTAPAETTTPEAVAPTAAVTPGAEAATPATTATGEPVTGATGSRAARTETGTRGPGRRPSGVGTGTGLRPTRTQPSTGTGMGSIRTEPVPGGVGRSSASDVTGTADPNAPEGGAGTTGER